MNIAPLAVTAGTSLALSHAGRNAAGDAAAQFDTMFYTMLLQSAKWTSGVSGGPRAEQALFGDMVTGFLAQEAARQHQGFGTMLLNAMDQQGKATT